MAIEECWPTSPPPPVSTVVSIHERTISSEGVILSNNDENPLPVIVRFVPPSLGPDEGFIVQLELSSV